VSLGRPVVLQGIQQEGGALLDQVALHEHVDDLPEGKRGAKNKERDEEEAQSRKGISLLLFFLFLPPVNHVNELTCTGRLVVARH